MSWNKRNAFKFTSPTNLILGNNETQNIGKYLSDIGVKKVLIITDKMIGDVGILLTVTNILDELNFKYSVYDHVHPEPPEDNVYDAYNIYIEENCDGVLGLGGGSPLDVAKAVAMLATNQGEIKDFIGIGKVPNISGPLILMPTTSGTGSEVSAFSILIVDGSKSGIVDDNIIADIALVDPNLTLTVPRKVTAATGLDALCHHIESFISVNSSPLANLICLEGIKIVGKHLRKAVGNGENEDARYWMSYASTLGGYVMNLTDGAAANHGLAFALGSKFNISHGLSNSVLLPYVLPLVGVAELEKIAEIGEALGVNTDGLSLEDCFDKTIDAIDKLVSDVGCKIPLSEFGVTKESIPTLVDEVVNTQQRVMGHSTYKLTEEEIAGIYRSAL